MAGYGVKVDSTIGKFADRLERAFGPTVGAAMLQAGELVAGEIRRQIAGWTSRTASRKTGALARSFLPSMVKNEAGEIVIGVYSKMKYARIHNVGGVIKPVSRSSLAVPLTSEAWRVGPRQFAGLKLIGGKAGAILATVNGKTITPQYALVKRVYITPKHYIDLAAQRALPIVQPRIQKAIQQAITRSSE